MDEPHAIPKGVQRIAGVLLAANALIGIVGVPAGVLGGVALFRLFGDPRSGGFLKREWWLSVGVGAAILGGVLLGLLLLAGYARVAEGKVPRWGKRRFWEVSASFNAMLAVAYAAFFNSPAPGGALVLVAWPVVVGVLSLVARSMMPRATVATT